MVGSRLCALTWRWSMFSSSENIKIIMFRPLPFRASWWHWGCCAPPCGVWSPWHQQLAAREHRCKDARRSICPPRCGAASSWSRIKSRWKGMRQNHFYPHIGGRYSIISNKFLTHLPMPQLVPCCRWPRASAYSKPPRTMESDGSTQDHFFPRGPPTQTGQRGTFLLMFASWSTRTSPECAGKIKEWAPLKVETQ